MNNSDYKRNVAIYLRKSRMDSEDESIDETLSRHADTLLQLADKLDLNIINIYKEVVSGDGLFTRPEMIRLLNDVEADKYTAICCMDIDRLGRSSQKDGGIILETLQEHNVYIITPNKTYNLNDEIDEQSVEMQTFIARQELKSIKRRLRRGLLKTIESGGHIAEPPYGYRRVYIDKKPTLEIHPEEADIIRSVFDMYVNQGLGSHLIAERLNNSGLKPRKGDHFSRTTIRFYLQNPLYTGKIIWNKQHRVKKKSYDDKVKYIKNPENEWIISTGLHPAIITQEIFDAAQKIRKSRSHPPVFTGDVKNQFAGLIYCKNCGAAMQRQFSKYGGNRLLCVNKGCNKSIKTTYIENYIIDILENTLKQYKSGSLYKNCKKKNNSYNRSELIRRLIKNIQKELTQLQNQRSSLHDLLEKGVYDIPTFLERSKIIADKMSACESEIQKNKTELNTLTTLPPIDEVIPTIEYLLNNYDVLSPAEKNTLFKTFIKKMSYLKNNTHTQNTFDLQIDWLYEF